MRHGMAQFFFEIAHDQEPDADPIANLDDLAIGFGEKRELQHDHLGYAAFDDDLFERVGTAQHRNAFVGSLNWFVGNQADRSQPDIRLSPQPGPQLRRFRARPDKDRLFFARAGEDSAGEKLGQVMMGKEQSDVEPRHEIEEEQPGDERVLRRDQIENEGADTGEGLAQTEPMLPEQFVLQKIIFRSITAQGFQSHAEHEQPAINGVAPPGPLGAARRIKRHHYPDAEPEKQRDHHDLAEQEDAIKTLRALRDHG